MEHTYLPSEWRKMENRRYREKRLQFCLFILGITFFVLIPLSTHADGYVRVNATRYIAFGHNLGLDELYTEIVYNKLENHQSQNEMPVYYIFGNENIVDYSVTGVDQDYFVWFLSGDCTGTVQDSETKTCNIRWEDRAKKATTSPTLKQKPIVPVLKSVEIVPEVIQPIVETSPLDPQALQEQIAYLEKMIELLKQLIALQTQLNSLKGI